MGENKIEPSYMSKATFDTTVDTQNTQKTTSISEQKLSTSYKIPKITTEYTTSPVSVSTNNPVPTTPKVDPYREIPE